MEQEEPPEETDLFLRVEGDDDDVEDPEITGTVVSEAVVPCLAVASKVKHAGRFVCLALRVRQAPTETLSTKSVQARCRTEGAQHRAGVAMMRPGQASLQPPRSWQQ